ncbi:MAG: PKD domain-containing protein, partial [Paludibacteraceae bacterium]|nr:PKD domain-containing protein [Paludibacteraceae bacterium]
TNLTNAHFLNVITETATCNNTKLTAINGAIQLDKSSLLTWTPVPGNTKYSYARVQIGSEATKDYSVFRIENSKGFIATVYGNGDDESYAYSAGSAAVELGINVNGETFVEGYRSDSKFCMADTVWFDAGIGTDEVTRVDWNFGDGTTLSYGEPQVEHKYLSPGWYDVTAVLYGTQACSGKGEQHLGDVHFSFRVVKQDTLIGGAEYHCLPIDTLLDDPERRAYLLEHGETKIITPKLCYEPVYINYVRYGEHADTTITVEDYDSVTVNGVTYYQTPTQPVIYSVPNPKYPNCNLEITCNVHVIKCLKMAFANDPAEQHICPGEALPISYSKYDGDIDGAARLYIPGLLDELVNIDNNNVQNTTILLPTFTLQKPGIYQAKLIVPDQYCDTLEIPIDFTVYYPSDIFKRKFYNVLAMYNKEYNGGYEFKYYEWHLIRNGQDSIIGEGKDLSVYHQDIPFEQNDIVYVVLTDKNDFTLRSCEQEWTYVSDEFGESTYNAPAQKVLRNQRMYVRIGDRVYDMYGQRVE